MARFIYLGIPAFGHVLPSLPLLKALVDSGDEGTYYCNAGVEPHVDSTGMGFQAYRNSNREVVDRESGAVHHDEVAMWCRDFFREHLEEIAAANLDYIVHDGTFRYMGLLSERTGVPGLHSAHLEGHLFGISTGGMFGCYSELAVRSISLVECLFGRFVQRSRRTPVCGERLG